jgi:hypothetical protein
MAYAITDKPNVEAPSADYPYGNIRDKTTSVNGTPVNKIVYADFHQFFAKLMDFAGVTPNGLPDNEYSGWQLMEALMELMGGLKTKVIEIGAWNMDTVASVIVPHGLDHTKIIEMSATIISDGNFARGNLIGSTQTGALGGFIGINFIDTSTLSLSRSDSGVYDNSNFSSTSQNRGFIIIRYKEDL